MVRRGAQQWVLLVAVAAVLFVAVGAERTLVLYERFSCAVTSEALLNYTTSGGFATTTASVAAHVNIDNGNQSLTLTGVETMSYAPVVSPFLNASVGSFGHAQGWQILNGQCRELDSLWPINMGMLAFATLIGVEDCTPTINGEATEGSCNRYELSMGEAVLQILFYTVEETIDGEDITDIVLPVQLLLTEPFGSANESAVMSEYMDLYDFSYDLPEGVFTTPELCLEPPYVCPAGDVVEMDMYRFHEENDYDIAQHNTADLVGEVQYLCTQLLGNADSQLSKFRVSVNTTWGQYGMCNSGICSGGLAGTVGHESAGHFGTPKAGQCDANEGIGNWFSLELASECASGEVVGTDGCAWQGPIEWYKTISIDCILDQGLWDACLMDAQMPFPTAMALLEAAFDSEDEEAGGCPNIYLGGAVSADEVPESSGLPEDDADLSPSSGLWMYAVVALAVGGAVLAALVVIAVVVVRKHKKHSEENFMALSDMAQELELNGDDL